MEQFTQLSASIMPVPYNDIDTDQIIPAEFLNLVPTIPEEYEKLGSYALWGLPESLYPTRYIDEGEMDSKYPIVVGGRNFGCGSSREHAPWALADFGIRCVIAPSFADIFFNNCFKNFMLPIVLPQDQVDLLMQDAAAGDKQLSVDLEEQIIVRPNGDTIPFQVDDFRRHCLLNGLDDIGLTMQKNDLITAFENGRRTAMPWL